MKPKALIVDKSPEAAFFLKRILEKFGFDVYECFSPILALSSYSKTKVNVAFIECLLEGIPGQSLAFQIRQKDAAGVIALTLSEEKDELFVHDALRKARINKLFKKPLQEKEIYDFLVESKLKTPEMETAVLALDEPKTEVAVDDEAGTTQFSIHGIKRPPEELRKIVKKLATELPGKTHYEIMGIEQAYDQGEISRAFREISKIYHPDLLQSWMTEAELRYAKEFFTLVSNAHSVLSDVASRESYDKELKYGSVQDSLEIERLREEGIKHLDQNAFPAALDCFESAYILNPRSSEMAVYCLWAQLEMMRMDQAPAETLKILSASIKKLDTTVQKMAEYDYVMGLYAQFNKETAKALEHFKRALTKKPMSLSFQRKVRTLQTSSAPVPEKKGFFSSLLKKGKT